MGCRDYSEMFFGIHLDRGNKVITRGLMGFETRCLGRLLRDAGLWQFAQREFVHMGMLTQYLSLCLVSSSVSPCFTQSSPNFISNEQHVYCSNPFLVDYFNLGFFLFLSFFFVKVRLTKMLSRSPSMWFEVWLTETHIGVLPQDCRCDQTESCCFKCNQ